MIGSTEFVPSSAGIARPLVGPMLFIFALLDMLLFGSLPKGADWAPLWVGATAVFANPEVLYDFEAITRLQESFISLQTQRPFVYPPTALLWLTPFTVLEFLPSFLAFVIIGGLLFARQAMKMGAHPAVLLMPPVVFAGFAGQTSFLVGGLGLAALLRLRTDALLAGVLLGLAASIKPTLFILAPFALLAGGHYRAIAAAAACGICVVVTSIVLFGITPWLAWFDALPRFQALFLAEGSLVRNAVTPYSFAARMGFSSNILLAGCAVLAVCGVVRVFREERSVAAQSVALFGGALLVAPYAMNYELALLAPAVMAIHMRRARHLFLPIAFGLSLFLTVSVVGLILAWIWFVATEWRPVQKNSRMLTQINVAA